MLLSSLVCYSGVWYVTLESGMLLWSLACYSRVWHATLGSGMILSSRVVNFIHYFSYEISYGQKMSYEISYEILTKR